MSDNIAARDKEWYEYYPLHKLWANQYFSLIPIFKFRKGDEYNDNSYSVRWLCFHFWSMSHFSFGLDIEISFSRIGFGFCLPWLRIWIGFAHFYIPWLYKVENFLRRKPAVRKEHE